MDVVLIIARLALVAVFTLAGASKLADLPGSRRAVAAFGVPERVANPIGSMLPFAELALALALLPAMTAQWAALGVLMLLLAFIAGMGITLARGEQPDCHCFGALHSEPVSARTMVRNVVLAAVAGFVVVGGWDDPGPGALAGLDGADPGDLALLSAGVALLLALIGGALAVSTLLHRIRALEARLRALDTESATPVTSAHQPAAEENGGGLLAVPIGTPAPAFEATALTGARFVFENELHQGRQLLLTFINPKCTACDRMLPRLARWQEQIGDRVTVVAISHGGDEENRAKAQRAHFPEDRYLVQDDRSVDEIFGVQRVPVALHIAPDGTLVHPVAGGAEAIFNLLDTITTEARSSQPTTPATVLKRIRAAFGVGATLPDQTWKENGTDAVQLPIPGRRTLMIFWSPMCPFCARLVSQLRQWEATAPTDLTLALLVLRGEEVDAARAQGLNAMVIEDDGIARAHYEVTGTPVTVLADANGSLAEPIAIGLGASQVLVGQAIRASTNDRLSG